MLGRLLRFEAGWGRGVNVGESDVELCFGNAWLLKELRSSLYRFDRNGIEQAPQLILGGDVPSVTTSDVGQDCCLRGC